jgi:hypothetical protein
MAAIQLALAVARRSARKMFHFCRKREKSHQNKAVDNHNWLIFR